MKLPNPFRRLTRKPGITVEFTCTACGQPFEHKVQRLYVDLAVSRRNRGQARAVTPGECMIPDQVVCPNCQTVDRYELAPSILGRVSGALLRSTLGGAAPDEPIQFIHLGSSQAANPAPSAGATGNVRPRRKRKKH